MTIELAASLEHRITPAKPPTSWDVVEPVFDYLDAMPFETFAHVEEFLDAWNEALSWIWDEVSKSRVAARSHTNDDAAQARWESLNATVLPDLSRRNDRLGRKLLASDHVDALEDSSYASFLRSLRAEVELFCEENIELLEQEQKLRNRYHQVSGGWSFEIDGEARTLSQMHRFLSSSDRGVREKAWRLISEGIAETSGELEDLFEQLFALRVQIANNAGFEDYREYVFTEKLRDYGPEACDQLAEIIEAEVVPLVAEIAADVSDRLGVDRFRPWDARAQPDGGEPLEPFVDTEELKDGVERMMCRLDPGLGERFALIRENMDLDSRANKGQGGFMTWYCWDKRPFIFANASGAHTDIVTLLHEAGHAFHGLLADEANARPIATVFSPTEFNEVASMSMEILHYDTLDEFYEPDDQQRAIAEHLRRIPKLLTSVARGDQFQHWLYTHPEHTREERRAKWQELEQRYNPYVDYSGVEDDDIRNSYHMILHFFVVPFYFIEYAFAQLGSLQIAMNAEQDLSGAMDAYKGALSLGPQRDVRGLYEAAGAEFVPTAERVRAGMDWIRTRLFE